MRRGRTVQIKTSSATAWTRSMTTLPFVSQPANCSTIVWPQLWYTLQSPNVTSASSISVLRKRLKTHLFGHSCSPPHEISCGACAV